MILQSRHWPVSLSASAIFPLFGAGATQDGLRKVRFALDSALEEAGFELAVRRRIVTLILVFAYVTPST
jgi:hypothetical protein